MSEAPMISAMPAIPVADVRDGGPCGMRRNVRRGRGRSAMLASPFCRGQRRRSSRRSTASRGAG